ncbi:hypothetical protein JCGZ_10561 [Jatropha curcas]|uniref:GRF-type domain-containing protein n=1 Tax=Jatropha curcas TaxID=180498 RepID=A0A067KF01_JATCU|nr:hypothetical protein JCGZ_10561 [Jatropha curcas]
MDCFVFHEENSVQTHPATSLSTTDTFSSATNSVSLNSFSYSNSTPDYSLTIDTAESCTGSVEEEVQAPAEFYKSFPSSPILKQRSMRAPGLRWTTSLHARFVHSVELLGGSERASPMSVLCLMDVPDLTLAQVKSHLPMYRTVKQVDKQELMKPRFCHCGTPCWVRTSRTEWNPGWKFVACENRKHDRSQGCDYFEWIDPVI